MQGAFYGLLAGHTCGVIRMILDFVYPAAQCGDVDTRPAAVKLHYTYMGQLIILITTVVMIVITYLTKPISEEKVRKFSHFYQEYGGYKEEKVKKTPNQ